MCTTVQSYKGSARASVKGFPLLLLTSLNGLWLDHFSFKRLIWHHRCGVLRDWVGRLCLRLWRPFASDGRGHHLIDLPTELRRVVRLQHQQGRNEVMWNVANHKVNVAVQWQIQNQVLRTCTTSEDKLEILLSCSYPFQFITTIKENKRQRHVSSIQDITR